MNMHLSRTAVPLLAGLLGYGSAHSWVEQLSNIAPNGSYMSGHGYPRGFVDKGIAPFDQKANEWLVPPLEQQPAIVTPANLLCRPSQRVSNQTESYPRLQAVPGGMVAMRYAENGHATLPNGGNNLYGKPKEGGTVFVFATAQPRDEEALYNVLQWKRDGSGGDRRGTLLTSQNFDDGRCYQLGNGAAEAETRKRLAPNPLPDVPGSEHELMCETDVQIPLDVEVGQPLTMYWVWQWPTAPGQDPNLLGGKDEYYTSCLDVDIVS